MRATKKPLPTFVLGTIQLRGADGKVYNVRGVFDENQIIVRADHATLSTEQIADHEAYHAKAREHGQRLNRDLRNHIKENFTAEEYKTALLTYRDAMYGLIDMQAEDALDILEEELLADAYAGIDIYRFKTSKFTAVVNDKMDQLYLGKKLRQENGTGQTNGPNGERFSAEYWYPKLNQQEWRLLEKEMARQIGSSKNRLDQATKWLYAKEKGVEVFAIYGIGNGTEATPLYASGKSRANADYQHMRLYLKGEQNGSDGQRADRSAAAFNRRVNTVLARQQRGQSFDLDDVTERGAADRNVAVYAGQQGGNTAADHGGSQKDSRKIKPPPNETNAHGSTGKDTAPETVSEAIERQWRERFSLDDESHLSAVEAGKNDIRYSADEEIDYEQIDSELKAQREYWDETWLKDRLGEEGYQKYQQQKQTAEAEKKRDRQIQGQVKRKIDHNRRKLRMEYEESKENARERNRMEETKPTRAKNDLRRTVLDLFSIPAGKRNELGTLIDNFADRLIKNGTVSEADRKAFFDRLYASGVMTKPADE